MGRNKGGRSRPTMPCRDVPDLYGVPTVHTMHANRPKSERGAARGLAPSVEVVVARPLGRSSDREEDVGAVLSRDGREAPDDKTQSTTASLVSLSSSNFMCDYLFSSEEREHPNIVT